MHGLCNVHRAANIIMISRGGAAGHGSNSKGTVTKTPSRVRFLKQACKGNKGHTEKAQAKHCR